MDFKGLQLKIEEATKKAFIEMYDKHKDEEIYSFSLYSDGGAMTVCPSTNTMDFLNNLSEEEKQELAYYKFEPAEWKYEMIGADEAFDEIYKTLQTEREKGDFENEKTFLAFRTQLYKTCCDVLEKLKTEDFFKNVIGKDIFLIFSVSDHEFEYMEIEKMIKKLNNSEYAKEYLQWMKTN